MKKKKERSLEQKIKIINERLGRCSSSQEVFAKAKSLGAFHLHPVVLHQNQVKMAGEGCFF